MNEKIKIHVPIPGQEYEEENVGLGKIYTSFLGKCKSFIGGMPELIHRD